MKRITITNYLATLDMKEGCYICYDTYLKIQVANRLYKTFVRIGVLDVRSILSVWALVAVGTVCSFTVILRRLLASAEKKSKPVHFTHELPSSVAASGRPHRRPVHGSREQDIEEMEEGGSATRI